MAEVLTRTSVCGAPVSCSRSERRTQKCEFYDASPGSPGMEQENQVVREKGVVKWFNAAKGYGFIQRASGEDVFVHFSAIEMSGYRTLEEGTEVEFEVKKGPKGLQAENVNRP